MPMCSNASYVTKRDGGIAYTYVLTWLRDDVDVLWAALVHRAGGFAGELGGNIGLCDADADVAAILKDLVHADIEQKVSVE